MKKMDISIIIPTLNEEKYLETCLRSLSKQEFNGNYEIIIGDGGSKDKTREIAKKYGAKFFIKKKPTISAGRQKACEKARGKIIVSTDADIMAPKDWLQKIWNCFYDKKIVGVYGSVFPYDGDIFDEALTKFNSIYVKVLDKIDKPSPAGSNLAFRRDIFKKTSGFNTNLTTAEDLDLINKLSKKGKIKYVPKLLVYISFRRIKEWGYFNFIKFHTKNAFNYYKKGKSNNNYKPIR